MKADSSRTQSQRIALWAGLSAFFGNVVGLKLLEAISGNDFVQLASALLLSIFVAGAVYSRERLDAARKGLNGHDSGGGSMSP